MAARLVLISTLALAPLASPVAGQPIGPDLRSGVPGRDLARTDEPPVIDGVPNDAAWADAAVIDDLRQVEPVEGAVPSERTEIRLCFDRDFLYIAFRCFDRAPERIIATTMSRDASLGADDHVSFVVDPYFDRRNAFYFEMNSAGARGDALIEDSSRFRKEWDGIWYGRAATDGEGWSAEFAIPFKTLSFDRDTTRWSFNALRFIRRRNETLRWATPSQNISFNSIADAGVLAGITDIEQGRGLDVKPFGLLGLRRDHDLDENSAELDGGIDLFQKLTPSLTLALTVNTDFAETEVNERRVNLTRFPLFFPEKRDFFLQDAGIFDFGGISRNPLPFQSRRIGLGAGGQARDILAGVKLTGRVGGLNLGLLDVQMKHDDTLGNKNLFVGRASVNVLEQSKIGAIFTYGSPRDTRENVVGGLDFNFRTTAFAGDRTLDGSAWFLHSDTTGVDGAQSAYGFKVGYPNDRVNWRAGFTQIDDDFNAALGFVPRAGIREYFANWRYRWRPESGPIRAIDSGAGVFIVTDLEDEVESSDYDLDVLSVETNEDESFGIDLTRNREVLVEPFEISDGVELPAGDYRFDRYGISAASSQALPVSLRLFYGGGDFFSGTRTDYEAEIQWRVSSRLFLGLEWEMNDIDLAEGSFITRIMRARVNVFFSPDLAWTNFVQFDNASDSIGINSRVRWIIEPGNEVFFVLNQAIDRDGGSYRVARTDLTTKVGWTFRF